MTKTDAPADRSPAALLSPLAPDEQSHFLAVSLDDHALRALATDLGTTPKGYRVQKLSAWELADSLVDHYNHDAEVSAAVDGVLTQALGPPVLTEALSIPGAAPALIALFFDSADPVRDLAWALLNHPEPDSHAHAGTLVHTIIEDFDAAEQQAEATATTPRPTASDVQLRRAVRDASKEAQRALSARERAEQRVDRLKQQTSDLEERLKSARQDLRATQKLRQDVAGEREQLQRERDALRAKIAAGTAGEVARLRAVIEATERRERALMAERDASRENAATLTTRLRDIERAPVVTLDPDAEPTPAPSAWTLPVFSPEFYDSLRGFDRRILRATFDKIHRLCEDWRHPSLRAIPLEGLPEHYRIRIAMDVRLIYRPLDAGRLEILSLIDRADLQRYIRNARG